MFYDILRAWIFKSQGNTGSRLLINRVALYLANQKPLPEQSLFEIVVTIRIMRATSISIEPAKALAKKVVVQWKSKFIYFYGQGYAIVQMGSLWFLQVGNEAVDLGPLFKKQSPCSNQGAQKILLTNIKPELGRDIVISGTGSAQCGANAVSFKFIANIYLLQNSELEISKGLYVQYYNVTAQ